MNNQWSDACDLPFVGKNNVQSTCTIFVEFVSKSQCRLLEENMVFGSYDRRDWTPYLPLLFQRMLLISIRIKYSLLELNILVTFFMCRSLYYFHKSKNLDTFSNVHSKAKNPADNIGQLVTNYSCHTLTTAPTSHVHAVETILFRSMQMFGSVIVLFEVHYQCTFCIFHMHLCGHLSFRAEEYFSDPTLYVRNDRVHACKNIKSVH